MKHLAIACAFLLGGCVTTTKISQITPQDVQGAVTKACGYVVPIAELASLIAATPVISTAGSLATSICSAQVLVTPGARPGAKTVKLNGVVLHMRKQP